MKYGKYVFNDKAQAEEKIADLYLGDNGEPIGVPHDIIRVGHEVISKAEFDEEGNVTKERVESDKYLVDVCWNSPSIVSHPNGWGDYSVEPTSSSHGVVGIDFDKYKF